MTVKIDGTLVKKSGGGGLGKLLGSIVGGAGGFFVGGPAGAMQGAALGGSVGGAIGGAVNPGKEADLGIGVNGAQGASTTAQPQKTSAIDRINSVMDLGQTAYGGATALQNLKAPKLELGAQDPISRRLNAYGRPT